MKAYRIILLILVSLLTISLPAQEVTDTKGTSSRVTAFEKWQPAVVTLKSGQVVSVQKANIFLKNSSLVYLSTKGKTLVVPTGNLSSVDINGRHYVPVDTMLYYRVDTVGNNALYCCTRIDIQSFRQQIVNGRDFTNVQLGSDYMSATTVDDLGGDMEYPIVNTYYYYWNGKWVKVHERSIWRVLPKSLRQDYKVAMSLPDFSWTSVKSLMDMLRRITK